MDTFKKIMRGIGKFLKKIKWLIILLVVGFIVLTAVKYNANKIMMQEAMSSATNQETATIEQRDVLNTITATGKIESAKTRTVASTIVKDTKITSVNCEEGDYVTEGDILVTFSYEDINKSIAEVKEDIAESKATQNVNDTANTRTYYYAYGTESMTMRDLQQTIDEKKKSLDYACEDYGKAKQKRDEIKEQLDATPEYNEKVVSANGTYETVYEKNSQRTSLESQLESAENSMQSAYRQQEQAQTAYNEALEALSDEVYKGSNTLAKTTEDYEKSVITRNDSTKSLQRQLEKYEDQLDDYVITAPISGTVTSVLVEENNSFAGGNMVTIQDCSTLYVSTEIDEYDIPDIQIGQRVVIKTDATREDELEGVIDEVKDVATSSTSGATSTSSSATYAVKVKIIDKDDRLKLGMTAKLSIILEERDSVLAVPYNAVVEKEDGSKVVYVESEPSFPKDAMPNMSKDGIGDITKGETSGGDRPAGGPSGGAPSGGFSLKEVFSIAYGKNDFDTEQQEDTQKEIPVTVGLESDYYTEISGEGIEEGLTVVIPSQEHDKTSPMQMMMRM